MLSVLYNNEVMTLWELVLIAISLSMDAFAVAMCKGVTMKKLSLKNGIIIAVFFGFFQMLMPFLGWLICSAFEQYIEAVDHWIAFGLLMFLGVKMIIDAIRDKDEEETGEYKLDIKELFLLAIATSIDALAVGITFALLSVNIYSSIGIIGPITFVISLGGVFIGHKFGVRFKQKAEIAGGIILCLLGIKILLEHLDVISF